MTHRYALFGQPIAHSLSPRIHAMFAAELGVALDYRAIEAGLSDFAATLQSFADDSGRRGDSTDGEGFVRDVESRHGFALRDRTCLVLGAGGAARAVAFAIAGAGAARVAVANRTHAG